MQAQTNPAPLHAALSASPGYTAAYDATGDLTCRASTSSTTCASGQAPNGG